VLNRYAGGIEKVIAMAVIQLPLFHPPRTLPPWWTAADSEIVSYYDAQESRTDDDYDGPQGIHARADEYRCRTCSGWASADGKNGLCMRLYAISYMEWEEDEPNDPEPFFRREAEPNGPRAYQTSASSCCEEYDPLRGDPSPEPAH
jgi:hypothetical protein